MSEDTLSKEVIDRINNAVSKESYKYNNVEWYGEGEPLFSLEQLVGLASEMAAAEVIRSRILVDALEKMETFAASMIVRKDARKALNKYNKP